MRPISTSRLKPIPALPCSVLHPSGVTLFNKSDALDERCIQVLLESGTTELLFLEPSDIEAELKRQITFRQLPVNDLEVGETLASPIMDEDGKLLYEANHPIPPHLPKALARRGIERVLIRKSKTELNLSQGEALAKALDAILHPAVDSAQETTIDDIHTEAHNRLKSAFAKSSTPFHEFLNSTTVEHPASEAEKQFCTNITRDGFDTISLLFNDIRSGSRRINTGAVDAIIAQIMSGMIQNRDILMYCAASDPHGDRYRITHALATAVIASNISISMGYDAAKVRVIVYGGLLADIGMFQVPEEIQNKPGKLTAAEFAEIRRHPAYGIDMLQRISNLPDEVPYIVYQTHERINGTGYPHGKKGVVIHPFAQLVSIADVYASVITKRPFREAISPYEAMERLVLMCGKKVMNPDYVRAFLKCNSMFPVGSYVQLSDKRFARAIAPNPSDFMRPLISILTDADGTPLTKPIRLELKAQDNLSVSKAIKDSDVPLATDKLTGF